MSHDIHNFQGSDKHDPGTLVPAGRDDLRPDRRRHAGVYVPGLPLSEPAHCRVGGYRRAVRVQCVETGAWFPSAVAAAASVDGDNANILMAARTGRRAYGFHWRKEGQPTLPVARDFRFPVFDLDHPADQWPSVAHVAKVLGVHRATVRSAIDKGRACRGRRLAFAKRKAVAA